MKKFLSLFAAILFAGSMMAADYVKVTTAPTDWSGDYLIVYEAGNVAFDGSLTALDAVENTIDVTIEEGKIAATDATNAAKFTIAAVTGGYSIQAASGKYIGIAGNSNGLKTADEVGDYTHDLSIDDNENAVIKANFSGSTMTMRFNAASNQLRFRYYKSGQQAVALYKYVDEEQGGGEQEGTVKTLYCKVAQDWWKADGAAVGIYAFKGETKNAEWPGVRMTAVEGETDLWKADIDTALYSTVIFTRFNPSDVGNQDWGAKTGDLAIPADKDLYTITSATEVWGDPGVTGEWSVYGEGGDTPVEIVLPVVKLAGSLTSWEEPVLMANAEDSLSATLTLNLGIDHYQLKVVSDNNWLTRAGEGDLFTMHRNYPHVDHLNLVNTGDNIKLITDVAGAYTFTWTYADSTLVVAFPEAPAQPKFYITGNEDIVGEGNPTWGKNGALESFSDTLVMNLAAGFHKFKLITPAEQWLGMEALTDTAYGLFTDDDTNICFNIAEAGEVTVIYNATEFKVEGDFYIAPVANYYLIGDSAFVVDAGATADKAWTPDAIASFKDTTVLNLKAGVDYIMRLSLNGTWENHRDFRHLTDTAAGLIELPDEYQNRSIGFQLAEAGEVTVIYIPAAEEQPEVFKLIGNFYVAPPADPTAAVRGSMNDWGDEIPFVLSDDKTYASLTVENISADTYEFKFIINGEYRSNGYRFHRDFPGAAGITGNADADMTFVADQEGEYTIQWYFANDSLAIIFPEYIEPAKEYYAKYAPAWEWVKLTEAEGLWLTDTIVYKGIGININDKADDENNMFYSNTVEEEGVRPIAGAEIAEKDTIYFTFNPADSVVTAVMVGKYVPQLPVVGLGANFNGWNWPENLFVPAEDSLSASFKITLGVTDTIEFKIVSDGNWFSLYGEEGSKYLIHRDWNHADHVNKTGEVPNFAFNADAEGEYIFTWTYADSTLVVTFPDAPAQPKFYIAGSMTDWAQNMIPVYEDSYVLSLEAGVHQVKVVDGNWLGFDALTADTRAAELYKDQDGNVCFVLAEAGNVTVTYTEEVFKVEGAFVPALVQLIGINGWTAATDAINMTPAADHLTTSVTLNLTGEWYDFKVIRAGDWLGKENEGSDNYRIWAEYNWVDGLVRDYDGLKAISLQPNGAGDYTFTYEYATGKLTVTFPTATAIDEIVAAGKAVKIVRNGQILIIKGEKIFNAQGQLVK